MESQKPMRVGVYIPSDLAEKIEKIMKSKGVDSLSKIVQEALRLYIAEHSWASGEEVVGAITVLYDHEVGHTDEKITDVQHKYLDIVLSATHIHLSLIHISEPTRPY